MDRGSGDLARCSARAITLHFATANYYICGSIQRAKPELSAWDEHRHDTVELSLGHCFHPRTRALGELGDPSRGHGRSACVAARATSRCARAGSRPCAGSCSRARARRGHRGPARSSARSPARAPASARAGLRRAAAADRARAGLCSARSAAARSDADPAAGQPQPRARPDDLGLHDLRCLVLDHRGLGRARDRRRRPRDWPSALDPRRRSFHRRLAAQLGHRGLRPRLRRRRAARGPRHGHRRLGAARQVAPQLAALGRPGRVSAEVLSPASATNEGACPHRGSAPSLVLLVMLVMLVMLVLARDRSPQPGTIAVGQRVEAASSLLMLAKKIRSIGPSLREPVTSSAAW